jgi:peptide/nickel transport system ATP-binding protein
MLDVITQAQIWDVLLGAVAKRGLGLLAVTHSAALAARISDRTVELAAPPGRSPEPPSELP